MVILTDAAREPGRPDPWKVLKDFLYDPETRRREALEDLRDNQTWIGTLKAVQATFPDDRGMVASCRAFILYHLSEIERLMEGLRKCQ